MKKNLSEPQQRKIQFLRGLAIIAVVFIHNTPSGLAQVYYRPFLNFSVGLFLFLSGMLSNNSSWNPAKRIKKVLIPYVLWTFVYSCLQYKSLKEFSFDFFKALITASSAPMMYYILVYIQFTLLIPLIDKLSRSKMWWFGFLISPIEIVAFRMMPLVSGFSLPLYVQAVMAISCLGWFTYFYLGYLLGNKIVIVRMKNKALIACWIVSMFLQIAEGYWFYKLGSNNAGTQLKLSAVFSGVLLAILLYNYIMSEKFIKMKLIELIGDISFGIFFSHIAVMGSLSLLPWYKSVAIYPFNAIVAVVGSCIFVVVGKKILHRYGKYFAL